MRLQSLHLHNFGSFAEAAIDLRDISASVITGSNGAGKSTCFVDAPLWALFGRCRTDADNMMRLGADEMMVSVTFALNGQRYCVIRKRSKKTKAGRSELQIAIERDKEWQPVSGARLVDTQAKIEQVLSADYDLLTSTGFLLQGQADRFSRATPAERKAILAQILRLDLYATLKQAAGRAGTHVSADLIAKRERVDALQQTAATRSALRDQHAQQSQAEASARESLAALERERATLAADLAAFQAKLDGLAAVEQDLEAQRTTMRTIETQIASLAHRQEALTVSHRQEIQREGQTRESLAAVDGERARLAADLAACQATRQHAAGLTQDLHAQLESLRTTAARLQGLTERHGRLQQILAREADIRAQVDEQAKVERQLADMAARVTASQTALDAAEAALEGIRQKQEQSKRVSLEVLEKKQAMATTIGAYRNETALLEAALARDQEAVALLERVPCDAGLQARCQFTVQAVESQRRIPGRTAALAARHQADEAIARALAPELVAEIADLDQRAAALLQECNAEARARADRARLQSQHRDLANAQQALQRTLTDLAKWTALVPELEQAKADLPALAADVDATQADATRLRARITDLEQALSDQARNQTREREVREAWDACEARKRDLDEILRTLLVRIGQATADLPTLASALASAQEQASTAQARIADLDRALTERPALTERVATLQADLEACDRRKSETDARLRETLLLLGQLAEQVAAAEQAAADLLVCRAEMADRERDLWHYEVLVEAYERIPVLILESSIPLLEEEANRILEKISTSGLRVSLETQKALKSRDGLAETLDIKVRDVYGERLLENYSGGERARVDLAVRIGLSKLLANRAGARLETLVVDEAFAAVDREGVEHLVECLPVLSQEFALVLFVTHDEAFKSAIAQQILVSRHGTDSIVEVVA